MNTLEKRLDRMRFWLIVTGVPLAVISIVFGIFFGGPFAIASVMGTYIAVRTADLIAEKSRS